MAQKFHLFLALLTSTWASTFSQELLVLTVATNETDGFHRYLRSAKLHNLNGKVLGMGEGWRGGEDMADGPGGGHKINLLRAEMEEHKERDDLVVMFTDSYDVVFLAGADEILDRFRKSGANVLFGAEGFCWPDAGLEHRYPAAKSGGKRFLNSGGFIGNARDIYDIVSHRSVDDTDDDQLYYTKLYVDEEFRESHNIALDHKSEIFQNLNGAQSDVELQFDGDRPYIANTMYGNRPAVLHGNGPSKRALNFYGNYVPDAWNKIDGCTSCWEDNLDMDAVPDAPLVVLAVFVEKPTPFIEEFFAKLAAVAYDKASVALVVHNAVAYHVRHVAAFADRHGGKYKSWEAVGPEDGVAEWQARNYGLEKCRDIDCDYYFSVDSDAHLDNEYGLRLLIEQNRPVVAPLLVRPYKAWSNFWGALTPEGYYARSVDYMDIVRNERRGVWNVPYIGAAYLVRGDVIRRHSTAQLDFGHDSLDADMAFCGVLRRLGVFMYVTNRADFGHLVAADDFDTSRLHNELWQISANRWDWERRYLHENYSASLLEGADVAQPCPDVYWFPIVSDRFAGELVSELEHYGKWSDGSNQDSRIDGGYESVPTRDIHMKQIGFEEQWLDILENYVMPLQEAVFIGYASDPPRSLMNFVVRYRPDEQPSLRPHHDSSTYTINIALNQAGVDYEGGGCRFIRYNCSVTDTKRGWMLMHPGRLTHYHEGLTVTKGTRYIMISFVDP